LESCVGEIPARAPVSQIVADVVIRDIVRNGAIRRFISAYALALPIASPTGATSSVGRVRACRHQRVVM
jgi:hypothetical protein